MKRRLRVLQHAYACEPGRGSEPGVGWNMAVHMARFCDVWVLTRANNRPVIDAFLRTRPVPGLHVEYLDLPGWMRWWKRGSQGVRLYYYLWQLAAIFRVQRLHGDVGFDLVHHVTFAKYWTPSALAFVRDVPFLWGPVGGGESVPSGLWGTLSGRGVLQERLRELVRRVSEWDPLVRLTARRAVRALASTRQTAARLQALGVLNVHVFNQVGLSDFDLRQIQDVPEPGEAPRIFLSVGNLLPVKGLHLGMRAFARCGVEDAEYWIVGDGPEERSLRSLASHLGVERRVRFLGQCEREQVLALMKQALVLLHPSLHDSGGYVCAEALAAGLPVCALDWGGTAEIVAQGCGMLINPSDEDTTVCRLAEGLKMLAAGRVDSDAMARASARLCWETRAEHLFSVYEHCLTADTTAFGRHG